MALANRGALIAFVARVGRDPASLPRGIRYTHVGIASYSRLTTHSGQTLRGYAIHNLYQTNDNARASEYAVDFLFDYFAEAHRLETGIIIPVPALQRELVRLIAEGDLPRLHRAAYSLIANPHDPRYQNCTEFVLDATHAAIYGTTDVMKLKEIARNHFRATSVDATPLRSLLASVFVPAMRFDDQGRGVHTATFSGISRYLQQNALAKAVFTIRAAGHSSD